MVRTSVRLSVCLLLICCTLPLMAQRAASADDVVPAMVKFTGTLNDINSKPLTGTVGVTFLLYKEQTGGAPLWMETQNVQADKSGHYSVMLGSATSHGMPAEAFAAGEARWLGVQPSGQSEQPRVVLASVPYALKALDAETLGGRPASAFMAAPTGGKGSPQGPLAEQPNEIVCSSGTACKASFVPLFSSNGGSAKVSDSLITQSGTTIKVAGAENVTGDVTSGGNLNATGNVNAAAVYSTYVQSINPTSGRAGVFAENSGGNAMGLLATATGTSGQGVWGESGGSILDAGGNAPDGVHGVAHSSLGSGVAGINVDPNGAGVTGIGGGWAFVADGNVKQQRASGGWVKAMVYASGFGSGALYYCYNSTLSGAAATTPPCGFTIVKPFPFNNGDYIIDFGFQVEDRLLSLTPSYYTYPGKVCTFTNGGNCPSMASLGVNQAEVTFTDLAGNLADNKFYIVVY